MDRPDLKMDLDPMDNWKTEGNLKWQTAWIFVDGLNKNEQSKELGET